MAKKHLSEADLRRGLADLERLSNEEYHQSLQEVAASVDPNITVARIGRLIGVSMRQPLAEPQTLSQPSRVTRAYRQWHLNSPSDVEQQSDTWQYQALDYLRNDPIIMTERGGYPFASVYAIASDAHHERGFFGYLARSVRAYICGDPEIRKKVEKNIKAARKGGKTISLTTPEVIVGSGGVALASYLVTVVPVLGFVGVPVIAGIVVHLYTLGIDAFCKWSDDSSVERAETHG